ncbi:Uu.00g026790.m01.CDS01 [Anthostomella pinea]|uniref:Uu.00g026790.m01.CDS01 n=1 Tax=Anthostomella pinea TaxID=933095 RepID=A0AAI8V8L8_9PEZI|nr:Uu.00g026790.m01.CDS01 [Anthostomella pinea]
MDLTFACFIVAAKIILFATTRYGIAGTIRILYLCFQLARHGLRVCQRKVRLFFLKIRFYFLMHFDLSRAAKLVAARFAFWIPITVTSPLAIAMLSRGSLHHLAAYLLSLAIWVVVWPYLHIGSAQHLASMRDNYGMRRLWACAVTGRAMYPDSTLAERLLRLADSIYYDIGGNWGRAVRAFAHPGETIGTFDNGLNIYVRWIRQHNPGLLEAIRQERVG